MENVNFRNNRFVNWARYNITPVKLAANTNNSIMLEKLVNKKGLANIRTLMAVANNPTTPENILAKLSWGKNYTSIVGPDNDLIITQSKCESTIDKVRSALEYNPTIIALVKQVSESNSSELLTQMAEHPISLVQFAVAKNPATPLDVLGKLINSTKLINFHETKLINFREFALFKNCIESNPNVMSFNREFYDKNYPIEDIWTFAKNDNVPHMPNMYRGE